MSSSSDFFKQLTEFLPKYVSPMTSYVHGGVIFIIVFIVSSLISRSLKFDIDRDGVESEKEELAKKYVSYAISFLIAVFAADMAYDVSWRIRNNRVNRSHNVWRKWFGGIYK